MSDQGNQASRFARDMAANAEVSFPFSEKRPPSQLQHPRPH